MSNDIFAGLNGPQRQAVENYDGASLIIAGAGSGKTRVLTFRIANMLSAGVSAYNIIALTFTNKAAREMKERISKVVSDNALRGIWMGTFHSIFLRVLRREAESLGFTSSFTIYDPDDCKKVIRSIIKELDLSEDAYKPNNVFSRISLAKNNLVTPDVYAVNTSLTAEDAERKMPRIADIYARYWQRCRQSGAMDYDDLLLNMNILIRDFPAVLEKYQRLFRYILVDEYQDTNFAQYLIIKKLAGLHGNICVVGDDSQSIYSFRGARIENILKFQKDYPEAKIIKLEQNYRSTKVIVEAANSVINKNSRRLKKELFSANEMGDKIKVVGCYTDKEEAVHVATDIKHRIVAERYMPADFAILYRTNAQSRMLEESLRSRNIPYKIYGGMSFYQRAEIKNIIAYIRLIVNRKDDEALTRIINFPARGIGDTSVGRVADAARAAGCSMWEVLKNTSPAEMGIRGGAVKSIGDFISLIDELSEKGKTSDAYDLGLEIVTRSGILQMYKTQQTPEAVSTLENIDELLNSIRGFTEEYAIQQQELTAAAAETETAEQAEIITPAETVTLDLWLQNVVLLTDEGKNADDGQSYVTLMTVHSAKGLEFKDIYIVGMEENLFPSSMSATADGIEEERRLFYVALTRAEKRATLTYASTRFKYGSITESSPSRFIKEIDACYLDMPADYNDDAEPAERSVSMTSFRERSRPTTIRSQSRPAYTKPQQELVKPPKPAAPNLASGKFRRLSPTTSAAFDPMPAEAIASAGELSVGITVEHDRFGRGRIESLEQAGADVKVTVNFATAGAKTLLMKYAKLRIV